MSLDEISERLESLLAEGEFDESVERQLARISQAVESLEDGAESEGLDQPSEKVVGREMDGVDLPETPAGDFPEPVTSQIGSEETWPEADAHRAAGEATSPFELPEGLEHDQFVTQGGMAEVHFVRDERLNRREAMKVIRADRADQGESLSRFAAEAQITAQLDHPGVPPVYRFGTLADDRPYFTMKALGETTLADVLRQVHDRDEETDWTRRRLLGVVLRVCETVDYAHRCGVIHRDLKPENVMVGPCGEVRVIDWGIARPVDHPPTDETHPSPQSIETDREDDLHVTMDGSIVGTAAYMAPEQVRGRQDRVGTASDVFSLGAILYEILTGEPAFVGDSHLEVMLRVVDAPETSAADRAAIPDELGKICERALDRRHSRRYEDAGRLRERLEAWRNRV